MSKASDAAVGMMDAAYFTGRKELLDFFNDLLQLNLAKIEQTASGAIACQITELVFPGSIPMSRVNWEAKSDYEFVQNYKLLQVAFTKHHVQRYVDVDKLIRAKYQDNLEFCQWLKAFYDQQGVFRDDYDPILVRSKGKGGTRYNQLMGKKSSSSSSSSRQQQRPGGGGGSSMKPTTTRASTVPTTTATANNSVTRPSRPLRERANDQGTMGGGVGGGAISNQYSNKSSSFGGRDEDEEDLSDLLTAPPEQNTPTTNMATTTTTATAKISELEEAIIEIERERDFYFEKLRNVEVLLQVHQEKSIEEKDPDQLIDKIFKILYATAEDNIVVNDEGDVVEGIVGGGGEGGDHSNEQSLDDTV